MEKAGMCPTAGADGLPRVDRRSGGEVRVAQAGSVRATVVVGANLPAFGRHARATNGVWWRSTSAGRRNRRASPPENWKKRAPPTRPLDHCTR
ncbi:MAG: hypothetical protein DMF84_11285 [Acidobacteria bacterium]|nr:MAG: hypothetical protein DMF84_11285 [Acidobacteriota bacterium]